MTDREKVTAVLEGRETEGIPSCYSLHFPADRNSGDAGIKSHLDFFRGSGCEIAKIMNENYVPAPDTDLPFPEAYRDVKGFDRHSPHIVRQMEFTKKIVDGLDSDKFTLGTMYGIVAAGIQPMEQSGIGYDVARALEIEALRTQEDVTMAALERLTESLIEEVKAYKEAGVDAIYYAALGGEKRFLTDKEFEKWFRAFDLRIMKAVKDEGLYCFLHICKDDLSMERFRGYDEYADCINWGVYEAPFSPAEARKLFPDAVLMGGMKNHGGPLENGTDEDIQNEVKAVVESFGRKGLIIGADCTLPTDQDMAKLRVAAREAKAL